MLSFNLYSDLITNLQVFFRFVANVQHLQQENEVGMAPDNSGGISLCQFVSS